MEFIFQKNKEKFMKFEIKSTDNIEETLRAIGRYLKRNHPRCHNYSLCINTGAGVTYNNKTFIVRGTDIKTQAETFQSQKTINESIDVCFESLLHTFDLKQKKINDKISTNESCVVDHKSPLKKAEQCATELAELYIEQNKLNYKIKHLVEAQKKGSKKINVARVKQSCLSPIYMYAIEYDNFYIRFTLTPSGSTESTSCKISDIKCIDGCFTGWEN